MKYFENYLAQLTTYFTREEIKWFDQKHSKLDDRFLNAQPSAISNTMPTMLCLITVPYAWALEEMFFW